MKSRILALTMLLGFTWAAEFSPFIGTNQAGRFLGFPESQGPMVLYSLKAWELQRQINQNREATISNLYEVITLERDASAQWRAQVEAEKKKADAEKKKEWVGFAIFGGGGILVGIVIGGFLIAMAK